MSQYYILSVGGRFGRDGRGGRGGRDDNDTLSCVVIIDKYWQSSAHLNVGSPLQQCQELNGMTQGYEVSLGGEPKVSEDPRFLKQSDFASHHQEN